MTFIVDLKNYLLWYPERTEELSYSLSADGFRVPVNSYLEATKEAKFVDRVKWQIEKRISRLGRGVSLFSVKAHAGALRAKYETELNQLLDQFADADVFLSKRLLPKIRYRLGRLSYLSEPSVLLGYARLCSEFSPLHFQSEVASAVASGNVDQLIRLGSNAVQAAAQPLRMATHKVVMTRRPQSVAEWQAYSIFAFNGVEVEADESNAQNADDLVELATKGGNQRLMRSENEFISEFACLHGISAKPRHSEVLASAFDEAEEIALDAIDQVRLSLSF